LSVFGLCSFFILVKVQHRRGNCPNVLNNVIKLNGDLDSGSSSGYQKIYFSDLNLGILNN
jgi:hypothetical protein